MTKPLFVDKETFKLDGLYILDADHTPVPCPDLINWAEWMRAHDDERHIAQDRDEGVNGEHILISTIFMGTDMRIIPSLEGGAPLLWETMVFSPTDILDSRRYTSHDAAFLGHQEMCRQYSGRKK